MVNMVDIIPAKHQHADIITVLMLAHWYYHFTSMAVDFMSGLMFNAKLFLFIIIILLTLQYLHNDCTM